MSIRFRLARLFPALVPVRQSESSTLEPLDYGALILLDAEDLAEQGMASAYAVILPQLRAHVPEPLALEEIIDSQAGSYAIRLGGVQHAIYSPELPGSADESWGRATYFFFLVVNVQLEGTPVRFYAINGGNDLGGMFLNEEQVQSAKRRLSQKSDWPHIPTLDPPRYGRYH